MAMWLDFYWFIGILLLQPLTGVPPNCTLLSPCILFGFPTYLPTFCLAIGKSNFYYQPLRAVYTHRIQKGHPTTERESFFVAGMFTEAGTKTLEQTSGKETGFKCCRKQAELQKQTTMHYSLL